MTHSAHSLRKEGREGGTDRGREEGREGGRREGREAERGRYHYLFINSYNDYGFSWD